MLPFEYRSVDADTEYLSDGLAESLIYRLSQLPNLRVTPTSVAFRYKGKEADALKAGSELGVSARDNGRQLPAKLKEDKGTGSDHDSELKQGETRIIC